MRQSPGKSMIKKSAAFLSLLALIGCGGNPFITDPGTGSSDAPVLVAPNGLPGDITSVTFDPASNELQIEITGLDTSPFTATWSRRSSLDVPGYRAFAIQEDSLDRLFVALAAQSADGAVTGVAARDGGQFNSTFSDYTLQRVGVFTPPNASGPGPGTGQVSYAGSYAGLLNGGGTGTALATPPSGTPAALRPGQPARISGDALINANFADNTVNGAITNRRIVDTGFGLESIILVPTTIITGDPDEAQNGTFTGSIERPVAENGSNSGVGTYSGIFGGPDASSVAGGIQLGLGNVLATDGTSIANSLEVGVFVLNQCGPGGPSDPPGCNGTAP